MSPERILLVDFHQGRNEPYYWRWFFNGILYNFHAKTDQQRHDVVDDRSAGILVLIEHYKPLESYLYAKCLIPKHDDEWKTLCFLLFFWLQQQYSRLFLFDEHEFYSSHHQLLPTARIISPNSLLRSKNDASRRLKNIRLLRTVSTKLSAFL